MEGEDKYPPTDLSTILKMTGSMMNGWCSLVNEWWYAFNRMREREMRTGGWCACLPCARSMAAAGLSYFAALLFLNERERPPKRRCSKKRAISHTWPLVCCCCYEFCRFFLPHHQDIKKIFLREEERRNLLFRKKAAILIWNCRPRSHHR